MHAAELRHRVVAVLDEHVLVQAFGARAAHRRELAAPVDILGELVEEEPAE